MCLLLLAWLGVAAYVELNKAAILQKVRTGLSKRLAGEARIGGLDISFFRHWPAISIRLFAISLRDSAWQQHHHDLLTAANVYLTCDPWKSLTSLSLRPDKIFIEHGQICFYTDSTGYTNTYIFHSRNAGRPGQTGERADLPDITLDDVRWVVEQEDKHKIFDLDIRHLACTIEKKDRLLQLHVTLGKTRVASFAFNTENGSFLKDKLLSGKFSVGYNTGSNILLFDRVKIDIDDHPLILSGRLFPTVRPDPFFITLETDPISFREVTAWLTPHLQQKLDQYDIDRPISVKAQLDAGAADDPTPQIQVRLNLVDGSVLTPVGRFTNVAFTGSFINEWTRGQKRSDENSAIRLVSFSGAIQDLPLRSDTITITNLKHPQMSGDLHSNFGLDQLNALTGSQTLRFTGGRGSLNVRYDGPLSQNDTTGTRVNGSLDIDSAGLLYLPYEFRLSDGQGRLLFKDQDLVIERLGIRTGESRIQVSGIARNLVSLLDQNTENVSMDWTLTTPRLDLEDLLPLAGRTTAGAGGMDHGSSSLFGATFSRIDRLLKEGAIHLQIQAADLRFRKFSGAHADADMLFDDHSIRLNRLNIGQGTGSIEAKALLSRQTPGETSPLSLEAHMEQVDLPRIFASFNNFGQDALVSGNLRGRLTAEIRMAGELTNKAKIVPNSLKGSVDFTIRDGELVHFAPIEKIKVSFLKNRDLSAIRFSGLENRLDVDSTTVTIHRMEINSSAFTLYVQGVYDLRTGPDMSLQIPLRNLSDNRYQDIPPDSRGNDGKAGPSIRLRARRGEDGGLKITWDPFKKALKKAKRDAGGTGQKQNEPKDRRPKAKSS